jgi:hypothetical protein
MVADFRRRHPMHVHTVRKGSCIGTAWRVQRQSLVSGEIRSSDHLVLDRPLSLAVDVHGTWMETPSDAQLPVHAPLKPQNRSDPNTARGAQGGCSWFCKQALPAATTVSSGGCQGSTAQFHAAPIQRRGICLETLGAPVALPP